jgi:two-component system response regulator DesR
MIRVLVVDDRADVRRAIKLMIEVEPDMTVVGEAADGETALPIAEAVQPNVALVDMQLPGMNGYEVIERLAESVPGCAAIMVSLYDSANSQRRALEAGAVAFVSKSRVHPALIQTIRAAAAETDGGRT